MAALLTFVGCDMHVRPAKDVDVDVRERRGPDRDIDVDVHTDR